MVEVETDYVEVEQQADDSKQRICPECGAAFSPRDARNVCCSDECKKARNRKLALSRFREGCVRDGKVATPRNCVICGKEFRTTDWRRRTCSHDCAVEHYKRSSHNSADSYIGGEGTRTAMRRARKERLQRDKARRIRFARLDALAPKPKIEIINRDGIIIERRGTVPAGGHAADFIRHS